MATKTFTFNSLPRNVEELQRLPEARLQDPFQAAALTLLAMYRYTESRDDGLAMINFLKGPQPLSAYETQFIRDRLVGKEHVIRSFFDGTSPSNDYTPRKPLTVRISDNPYTYGEAGYAKLVVQSSGADSPRPIKLRQLKTGTWCLWENLFLSDIRQPASANPWA